MNFPFHSLKEKSANFRPGLYKAVPIIEEVVVCYVFIKLDIYLSVTSLSSLKKVHSGFFPLPPPSFYPGFQGDL